MRLPVLTGAGAVVGLIDGLTLGIAGGTLNVVRSVAHSAAENTSRLGDGAVQIAQTLVDPVIEAVHQSAGRMPGRGAAGTGPATPVCWRSANRMHFDLGDLLPLPLWQEYSAVVEEPVRRIPGVATAHVEEALGRLVIELNDGSTDPTTNAETIERNVRDAVVAAITDVTRPGHKPAKPTAPFADPGDPLAVLVPLTAAGMDVLAIGVAITGWVGRLPVAPRAARGAAAVMSNQPRIVSILESRLGRVGTDLALAAATAAANGLTQSVGTPLVDLAQRSLQIAEATAHRRRWAHREPALASARRPQAPVIPVISSAGSGTQTGQHWGGVDAGEASHVVVDGAIDSAVDSAKGSMSGPVENYAEQAASGSLVAAAGALLAGGAAEEAAGAVLAGVPKAAYLGRQSFAAVLGRGLAEAGQMVLDPGALRRLDRVRAIVIDGAALRGDVRAVLHARGELPGWDEDRVYEVADALLHGEKAPEPDPDELPATRARLRWIRAYPSAKPAQGLEHADLVVDGETVGRVEVGWEVDPFAVPLLQTAQRTGTKVVLRHVAGTLDLAASVAATHPAGTPLLKLVRDLRNDRGPVLLITALHPDFASTDTLAALAVADVGVALDDPLAATPWTADIITGTDLAAAVRLLSALPVARRATESSVRLAQGGSTLAGLLLVAGDSRARPGPLSPRRWLNPVNAAAVAALASGAASANKVLRQPTPTPQPLTAWHALDPEIVYSRLTGRDQPLDVETGPSTLRRALTDFADLPLLAALRNPASRMSRLVAATRRELADPLTPVLAVGAAASAIVGSNVDALLVAGVMTVNAVVGGVQRLRAEAAVAQLFAEQDQLARRVVLPTTVIAAATKRRFAAAETAQRTVTVLARALRPGDVIDLAAPDVVPADARLLSAEDLEVDESFLTGESLPVEKDVDAVAASAAATERASMVFGGSTIVAGHGRAIVVATGAGTAARRAISAVADVESAVGVQARLRSLTAKVLPLTLAGGAAVTGLVLVHGGRLRQAIADGVAVAVAAVPEGLPLVASLAQLAAAQRLSRHGVLVRTPRAVEALGRVDTICFDKTGTLTENRLRVVRAVPHDAKATGPFPDIDDPRAAEALRVAARACPVQRDGQGHAHATDEAILTAAAALTEPAGGPGDPNWTVLAEVPFESSRGYAASIGTITAESAPTLVIKGAPEELLPRCGFNGEGVAGRREDVEELVYALAGQGLRVLAVARRSWAGDTTDEATDADAVDAAAHDLELVGLVGLADTPRPSARPLIEALVEAKRRVVLITGDHPVTARAIARQLGLPDDAREVTGAELAVLDEDGFTRLAADVQVFARVSPEQKVHIVAALQRSGQVTAMVGDGANDAAAIRIADVGVGVSGRGSSAARGAADIVLTDDDLRVLLDALVEGRGMWAGVRDAVSILVGGNVGEVLFTIIGTALGSGRAPVGTRQLLLVNLLTDMFPALAVAVTPQYPQADDDDAEAATPAERAEDEEEEWAHQRRILMAPTPSLDSSLMRQLATRGAVTAAGATAAWAIGRYTPGSQRRTATMGLTALVMTQLVQTLLMRRHSPLVVATALGSAVVLVGIVQTPGVSHFFGCTPLGPVAWTGVLACSGGAAAISALAPSLLSGRSAAATPEARSNRGGGEGADADDSDREPATVTPIRGRRVTKT